MSESFFDLGYTRPEDVARYREQSEGKSHELTSTQKNHRARRIEEEHQHNKRTGIMEPSAEALASMRPEEKAETIEQIKNARAALRAGEISAQAEVVLEPVQPELPFE